MASLLPVSSGSLVTEVLTCTALNKHFTIFAMNIRLFTYGTLEIPEVIQTVTGRQFTSLTASVEGYGRYLLKNRVYPVLIHEDGARTTGTLYLDLDRAALAQLDDYEDTCYEKKTIQVLTEDRRTLDALVYILPDHSREQLSSRGWDREIFIRDELERFLRLIKN